MFGKKKVAMLAAEVLGTALLTLAVISVRSSGIGYSFFVASGAGLAMAVLTFVLGANSGAQFNPALTLGLWVSRKVKTVPGVLYVVAQLLGAFGAYGLFVYFSHTHLPRATSHYDARLMLAEGVGTLVFAFGWAAAAAQKLDGIQRAVTIGGAFAVGIMIASLATVGTGVGVANPAIAFGTRAWTLWGGAGWTSYVLGPVVGGVVGVGLYNMLFADTKVAAKSKK